MNHVDLQCRLEKCAVDNSTEMELKKCITQNDKAHPDRYNPCPYLRIVARDEYSKGEVWKKFGDIIDKSRTKGKGKML
jgi:hypothetical protein